MKAKENLSEATGARKDVSVGGDGFLNVKMASSDGIDLLRILSSARYPPPPIPYWTKVQYILEQQPPSTDVLLYNLRYCSPFIGDERMLGQCAGKQRHRLLDLAQASFPRSLFSFSV